MYVYVSIDDFLLTFLYQDLCVFQPFRACFVSFFLFLFYTALLCLFIIPSLGFFFIQHCFAYVGVRVLFKPPFFHVFFSMFNLDLVLFMIVERVCVGVCVFVCVCMFFKCSFRENFKVPLFYVILMGFISF